MKKTFFLLFAIIIFHFSSTSQCPQVSKQVLTTHHGEINEVGAYNSFGLRITLDQTYSADVTVTGVIFDSENHNVSANFNITVPAGYSTQDADDLLSSGRESYADAEINSISPCFISYAGVTIVYETDNHILRFASISDVYAVLNQLEADYNSNYDYHDSQIDTSQSVEILDSLDEISGFDPFITYRNFEGLFPDYSSKRMEVESTEITWLANDFESTHPFDIDLTLDDAMNTISNSSYSFKIGNDVYQITSDGTYMNGNLLTMEQNLNRDPFTEIGLAGLSGLTPPDCTSITNPQVYSADINDVANFQQRHDQQFEQIPATDIDLYTTCKTNKKKTANFYYNNGTERYELEAAIHSVVWRSSIKGKVIHFKKKNNGNWKRSRAQMAAGGGGTPRRDENCLSLGSFAERNPYNGYKKREEITAVRHSAYGDYYRLWKTYTNEVFGSFETPNGSVAGTITITF